MKLPSARLGTCLLATQVLIAVAFSASFAADCPSSCVWRSIYGPPYSGWGVLFCSPEASQDTSGNYPECYFRTRYDVAQGLVSEETASGFNGCYFRLTHDDDFRVDGLPAGTTIPLSLRLNAHFETYGLNGGEGHIAMSSPTAGAKAWDLVSYSVVERDTSLVLGIVAQEGVPFAVSFEAWDGAYGEASASIAGSYLFEGLPAGASITSCRGYSQTSVRTRDTTWGHLKATYR